MKQSQVPERAGKLASYQALVERYYTTLDLVSPVGLRELPSLIEEALLYAKLAPRQSSLPWLDVGSGAGLPAIPLAIQHPEIAFTLVERRRRRAAFLKLLQAQLELENVTIIEGDVMRIQRRDGDRGFAVVSAQAVGSFATLYRLSAHLLASDAVMLARKGADWQWELPDLLDLLSPTRPTSPNTLECEAASMLAVEELALARHGRLVSVRLPGGQPCPSSG